MSKVYSSVRLFSQTILRAAACLAALFIFTVAASAATFTVDTTADNAALTACTAAAGDCSLRGAIAAANATVADDTIDFAIAAGDAGCTGGVCTITLTDDIAVNDASTAGTLTITNSTGTSNLLISGNMASRVFFVRSGATLTISGLTVTKGNGVGTTDAGFDGAGGGIVNFGALTLTNVVLTANAGNNGGGILNSANLTLTNSTVSGNTATLNGAGIYNFQNITTLTNSTVSGNTATQQGGGIYNSSGFTVNLTNSTVSGNTAQSDGGGIRNEGTLNLNRVTVTRNSAPTGGGIINLFSADLNNTIVAGNTATTAGDAPDFSGDITSTSTFNLIGNDTGTTGITNGTNGNQVGTAANPIDAKLDPNLAFNGGTTQNHALLFGSPALDKGNATGTDQRGFNRPVDLPSIANATGGNGADIGAFEAQTAPAGTTAASVSISGRVTTITGRGIMNVRLSLIDSSGQVRTATTTAFGYYRFDDVQVGETYILSATGKHYTFSQQLQVLNINEEANEVNFIADSEKRARAF